MWSLSKTKIQNRYDQIVNAAKLKNNEMERTKNNNNNAKTVKS